MEVSSIRKEEGDCAESCVAARNPDCCEDDAHAASLRKTEVTEGTERRAPREREPRIRREPSSQEERRSEKERRSAVSAADGWRSPRPRSRTKPTQSQTRSFMWFVLRGLVRPLARLRADRVRTASARLAALLLL